MSWHGRSVNWTTGLLVAALVGVSASGGCDLLDRKKPEAAAKPLAVRTLVVGEEDPAAFPRYAGQVVARYESPLAFEVAGRIAERRVDVGDRVKKGQTLFRLDQGDLQLGVKSSQAELQSMKASLSLAQAEYDRNMALFKDGYISRNDMDAIQRNRDVAASNVRNADAAYRESVRKLDYGVLVAPHDGVIASVAGEVGQVVTAHEAVASVMRTDEREVESWVPESRMGDLKVGGVVSVDFWALPDAVMTGKVREIAPAADDKTRTYRIRVALPGAKPEVRPGMTANLQVRVLRDDEIHVPLSAILQTGHEPGVWVVSGDRATRRAVRLGILGKESVAVLEGLAPGDRVVTAGVQRVEEGMRVRLAGEDAGE